MTIITTAESHETPTEPAVTTTQLRVALRHSGLDQLHVPTPGFEQAGDTFDYWMAKEPGQPCERIYRLTDGQAAWLARHSAHWGNTVAELLVDLRFDSRQHLVGSVPNNWGGTMDIHINLDGSTGD